MIEKLIQDFMSNKIYTHRTPLCELMKQHGSDKSTRHNYTTLYDYIFDAVQLKTHNINLFEMGIGSTSPRFPGNMGETGIPGASLRAWAEYLPLANIYGADVDSSILFEESRIKTFWCEQTDGVSVGNMWRLIPDDFDIIVDDGLHSFLGNTIFFKNSFHKLKSGGLYFIEDICPHDICFLEKFLELTSCSYKIILTIPHNENNHDNSIAVIEK